MPEPTPVLSAIVVCKNPGAALAASLASIWVQYGASVETIVVDGASTDGTVEWLAAHRARITTLVSEPDRGVYEAMNKGIAAARGEWVLFLGADDRLADEAMLTTVLPVLQSTASDVVVGESMYDDGRKYRLPTKPAVRSRNFAHHQATFYRRSLFAHHGTYDSELHVMGDLRFEFATLEKGREIFRCPATHLSLWHTGAERRGTLARLCGRDPRSSSSLSRLAVLDLGCGRRSPFCAQKNPAVSVVLMAETFAARVRRLSNGLLHPLGLHLSRRDRAFEMDDLLARAAQDQTAIQTWIDVGASNGIWSLRARKYFPHAHYILLEPLAERRASLAQLEKRFGWKHVAAAAGPAPGEVAFTVDPQLDGSGAAVTGDSAVRTVRQTTIDEAVRESGWPGPYGIKLDTHGYEIPILNGAHATLTETSLLIVEAYNFDLTPNSLRFPELCRDLETRGFRCTGLADPMNRPSDGALWQMDLCFAPSRTPLFQTNYYR